MTNRKRRKGKPWLTGKKKIKKNISCFCVKIFIYNVSLHKYFKWTQLGKSKCPQKFSNLDTMKKNMKN